MPTDERENKPSASEMFRVAACLGYLPFKAALNLPPEPASEDAALGTLAHEILREEGRGMERLSTHHSRWIVSESLNIRDGFVREIFGENPVEVIKEQRFWLYDISGQKIFSGQVDYCALRKADCVAVVVDYKHLFGDTDPAEANWQLLSQCACLFEDLKKNEGITLQTVYAAIVQPAVNRQPSLVRFGPEELVDIGALIRRRLRESAIPGAPRNPGQHCSFCPLAAHCPEAQSMSVTLYSGAPLSRVNSLTAEEIVRLLPTFPVISKVIEKVKERAEAMAAAGLLPGYEMKDGHVRTEVTNILDFYSAIQEHVPIGREEFQRNLRVSKEGLEEMFREKYVQGNGGTRKAASELFKELVTRYGDQRPTKARLVAVKQKAQVTQ